MGVTISSREHSIDMGAFGFFRLRRTIAGLISEEFGNHYSQMLREPPFGDKKAFWQEYDAETERLASAYPRKMYKVFDFLYASDVDGTATYGTCKELLKLIGDYDDTVKYGYAGRPDCAMFADFKQILQDCAEEKTKLRWY